MNGYDTCDLQESENVAKQEPRRSVNHCCKYKITNADIGMSPTNVAPWQVQLPRQGKADRELIRFPRVHEFSPLNPAATWSHSLSPFPSSSRTHPHY